MKLLAVGDIVGKPGLAMLSRTLPALKKTHQVDFCIANGENACGFGIDRDTADQIFACGVDVITLGNHTFDKRDIVPYLEDHNAIVRPANMSPHLPGASYVIVPTKKETVCVVNLIGMVHMQHGISNPFHCMERLLPELQGKGYTVIVDFHAEATSEKQAMSYFLKGKVSALFGTHTHVQTNDARVLPGGMGFMCDLGMTGCIESVIGMYTEKSVDMFLGRLPQKHPQADGPCMLCGALFTIENERCTQVETICIRED